MVSQLLVASGVAAACGFLGVTEWLRERSLRIRATPARTGRRPTQEPITPLDAMIGFRRPRGR